MIQQNSDTRVLEYSVAGKNIVLRKDAQGRYHVDDGDRRDIHGPMDDEAVIAWMSNVIHNMTHCSDTPTA